MPAPSNLSFETGATGAATGWSLVPISSFEELAAYDSETRPWERFEEGWDSVEDYLFSFEPGDIELAEYGTIIVDTIKLVENFEELWDGNEAYLTSLDSPEPEVAEYDVSPEDFEDFQEGWDSNENYVTAFTNMGDLAHGDFEAGGGSDPETFGTTGWTTGYKTSFIGTGGGGDLTLGTYGIAVPYETFFSEQAPRQFSVNTATDVLTFVGSNPFTSFDKVFVTASGSYPAPLQASQTYYARDESGLTCKLSLSPGGTAIDITGTPDGDVFLTGDPVVYWTEKMVTTAF